MTEAQRAPVGVRAARCNGGNDSRRLRLVIDAKQANRRRRRVLESQERTMRTVEAEKQHGRRSWILEENVEEKEGRREEKEKKNRGFDGASSLLLFGEEEKLEGAMGRTDREACVGTRGTGSKMEEEGRRKRMKARLGTRGEEERRSRERKGNSCDCSVYKCRGVIL